MSPFFSFGLRLLLTAALVTCAGYPLPAQQDFSTAPAPEPAESSAAVIRKSVRRVIVDVVVTDSSGKPVRGLTREDFAVEEDGKPQRLLSFDVHDDVHDFEGAAEVPPVLPRLPPNTFMNVPTAQERGPLYVILYDMLNMRIDDQALARGQLLNFIAAKPPGARFAVFVLSDGLRLIQGFTADQTQLFAAMDPKTPRPHVPKQFLYGDNFGVGEVNVIVSAFTEISHFLYGLPGRKNVIWITGSLSTAILPTGNPGIEAADYSDEIKKAIDAMARSQVAVYPVDVRGVVIPHGPGGAVADLGASLATIDSVHLAASYATEDDIADATGGRAFYSSNDLKEALTKATETGAEYYTLSYAPSNQKYDGRIRKIHVEVSRHGYHLSYRHSYYGGDLNSPRHGSSQASDPEQQTAPRAGIDSLLANIQHGAPLAHELLFRAHIQRLGSPAKATPAQISNLEKQLAYFGVRPRNRRTKAVPSVELQAYAIDLAVLVQPHPAAEGLRRPALEFAAVFYDAEGQMLSGAVQSAIEETSLAREQANSRPVFRAQQQINAPLNATSIRIAVRDVSTDHVGAMEVTLPLAPEPEVEAIAPAQPG
jgi:VWFA-related protein